MLLLMKHNPYLNSGGLIKLSHTMKLAGFSKEESKSKCPECVRCFRKAVALKELKERRRTKAATSLAEARARATQKETGPPLGLANASVPAKDDSSEAPSLSPNTQDSNGGHHSSESDDKLNVNGSTGSNRDDEEHTAAEEDGASSSLGPTVVPDDFEQNQCVC